MMTDISTYNFNGDIVTVLGFVGVVSTLVIVATAFRKFYNSPYNVRVVNKTPQDQDS